MSDYGFGGFSGGPQDKVCGKSRDELRSSVTKFTGNEMPIAAKFVDNFGTVQDREGKATLADTSRAQDAYSGRQQTEETGNDIFHLVIAAMEDFRRSG